MKGNTRFAILLFIACFLLFVQSQSFSDGGAKHKRRQQRPVRMGTSGGNNTDITADFCCGGTLGAVVRDAAGTQYILSNNHVVANSNSARVGDPVGQPSLIDARCQEARAEPVATLSRWRIINFSGPNRVDAAIAQAIPGRVNRRGAILDIRRPGRPRAPALNLPVKKSGRTTGLTFGRITAVNVTVRVDFPRECGSENMRTARFVNQFVVEGRAGARPFTRGGDSGSLIVQRRRNCPPSVGLLFAGDDDGLAVANKIQNVLRTFQVSIVGCAPATATEETDAYMLTEESPALASAKTAQAKHEEALLRIPGVVGVGLGSTTTAGSAAAIVVFVKRDSQAEKSRTAVPLFLDGIPVHKIPTSGFRAL